MSAEVELTKGDTALFVLEILDGDDQPSCNGIDMSDALLDATTSYWRSWLSQSRYVGRWREMVHRSAITLKLLTHEPTGAVIAAPTTSIPEFVGGSRNWDYRYVWVRDAGFSLYALLRLGFTDEARAFIGWLSERLGARTQARTHGLGPLRVLYDIDGNRPSERPSSITSAATAIPSRCGSATPRWTSCSWTSTASSSTRSTCSTSTARASAATRGTTSSRSSNG